MNETNVITLECDLIVREGVSKKTGNPYRMYLLRVNAGDYGTAEILLDTRQDRGGILLSVLAENMKKGV